VVALWSHIVLACSYYGILLLLHLFWMIILPGRVSWGWSYFHSVPRRPHPKLFLLLMFLLRSLLWFWWVYFCMLFVFFSYSLQYSFSSLCICCFNDNMPWGSSILVSSVWCSGGLFHLGIDFSRFGKVL
jgi:hypothetical protein